MRGQDEISTDKFIDSRDVEARIDYLESLIADHDPENLAEEEAESEEGIEIKLPEIATCGTCGSRRQSYQIDVAELYAILVKNAVMHKRMEKIRKRRKSVKRFIRLTA